MPRFSACVVATLLVAHLAAGCAGSTDVDAPPDADFVVIPAQVQSGDSLQARLVIRNPSSDTLRLASGSSCVATLAATFGGEQVPLEGTLFGCLAVVTSFPIAPGDSLVRVFDLRARLHGVGGAPSGTYQLTAVMQVQLADIERTFVVVG